MTDPILRLVVLIVPPLRSNPPPSPTSTGENYFCDTVIARSVAKVKAADLSIYTATEQIREVVMTDLRGCNNQVAVVMENIF